MDGRGGHRVPDRGVAGEPEPVSAWDAFALGCAVMLIVVPVGLAVVVWRSRPVEVPDEWRCAECGRWLGHRLRCPER